MRVSFRRAQTLGSALGLHVAHDIVFCTFPAAAGAWRVQTLPGLARALWPGVPPSDRPSLQKAGARARPPGARGHLTLFLYLNDMNVNGTAQGRSEPVDLLSLPVIFFAKRKLRVAAWTRWGRELPNASGSEPSVAALCAPRLLGVQRVC